MGSLFARTSLELLKSRIDLIEVVSPYLKLQRSGSAYKALCPFHEEKTPSFIIQHKDTHYHCFGCNAHGDAIQFLMTYLKMSFVEAVETLAEKFHVTLEMEGDDRQPKGPAKTLLKDALQHACAFYHFYLLHTLEGHAALDYLYHRGIDLEFIQKFSFGLAPKNTHLFDKVMQEQGVSLPVLEEAGLYSKGGPFFSNRITIPICDTVGDVIGFSARKYKEETFGGKYINSPETPLFKKSKVLFGLSFSRKTIAKERKALIVEGQLDCLRVIHAGFPWVVAGQGTAFGEEMVQELIHLGVRAVFLALDGDVAGQQATVKIGNLFQKEGIEVFVLSLPEGTDPDQFLQEKGPEEWQKLLDTKSEYLPFLIRHLSQTINIHSPAGKNELVQTIVKQIRTWDHPLMIHESLRKLSHLTNTPETMIDSSIEIRPLLHMSKAAHATLPAIDPNKILEADLLRWLLFMGETDARLVQIAEQNILPQHFCTDVARTLYEKYLSHVREKKPIDLLSLAIDLDTPEQQLFLSEILQKKVNRDRVLACFTETIQKILERDWMQKREAIRSKIYSGTCSEEEVLALAKQFDALKKERPEVKHVLE